MAASRVISVKSVKSLKNQNQQQTGETQDLFAGVARAPRRPASTLRSATQPNSALRNTDHLAATRRLHWKLRRAQSHSPEEVKAGRLICQHLLAMLDEAQVTSADLQSAPEPQRESA